MSEISVGALNGQGKGPPTCVIAILAAPALRGKDVVVHVGKSRLRLTGRWDSASEPLYDGAGNPLWFEHPTYGRQVDVVALPLTQISGVQIYAYDPANPGPGIVYGPSDPLSIIGFPFGMAAGGGLGIWVQGTVASEPDIDFNDLPCLLVDSRTRSGQSGSPVIAYRTSGYQTAEATMVIAGGVAEQFIGVYSGRINEQSDLGFVWKASALVDILNGQQRGPLPG